MLYILLQLFPIFKLLTHPTRTKVDTTSSPVESTLEVVDTSASQSKGVLMRMTFRGFMSRYNPLAAPKSRKDRLAFTSKKHFLKIFRTKWNPDELIAERCEEERMEKERKGSWFKASHHLSDMVVEAVRDWVTGVYWWCDCWYKKQDEFLDTFCSDSIKPWLRFTVRLGINQNITKAAQELEIKWPNQSPDLFYSSCIWQTSLSKVSYMAFSLYTTEC